MPVYEFECESCNLQFEMICQYEDIDKIKCPECKSKKVNRSWGSIAISFKGSGFYVTDNKSAPIVQKETKIESKKEKSVDKGNIKRN